MHTSHLKIHTPLCIMTWHKHAAPYKHPRRYITCMCRRVVTTRCRRTHRKEGVFFPRHLGGPLADLVVVALLLRQHCEHCLHGERKAQQQHIRRPREHAAADDAQAAVQRILPPDLQHISNSERKRGLLHSVCSNVV